MLLYFIGKFMGKFMDLKSKYRVVVSENWKN